MAVEVKRLRCAVRRVCQHPIADQAPIDEEELIATAAEAKATGHEAGGVRGVVTLVDLLQIRRRFVAQNLNHPFPKCGSSWQVEHGSPVVLEAKATLRKRQGVRRDHRHHGAKFRFGAAQEFAAGRHILEQLAHHHRRSAVTGGRTNIALSGEWIALDLHAVRRRGIARGQLKS